MHIAVALSVRRCDAHVQRTYAPVSLPVGHRNSWNKLVRYRSRLHCMLRISGQFACCIDVLAAVRLAATSKSP
jgi:hypothetical protein